MTHPGFVDVAVLCRSMCFLRKLEKGGFVGYCDMLYVSSSFFFIRCQFFLYALSFCGKYDRHRRRRQSTENLDLQDLHLHIIHIFDLRIPGQSIYDSWYLPQLASCNASFDRWLNHTNRTGVQHPENPSTPSETKCLNTSFVSSHSLLSSMFPRSGECVVEQKEKSGGRKVLRIWVNAEMLREEYSRLYSGLWFCEW